MLAVVLYASSVSPRVLWLRMRWLLLFTFIGAVTFPFSTTVDKGDSALTSLGPLSIPYSILYPGLGVIAGLCLLFLLSSLLPLTFLKMFWQKRWTRRLRLLFWLLMLGSLASVWLMSGTVEQALSLGPIFITRLGVWTLVSVEGLLLLYSFSLLVMLATSPMTLVESVTRLMAPLRLLRFPVDDFALMFLIALRFIPTLIDEIEQLGKAQMARGASLSDGTLTERFQGVIMLVIPLLRNIFQRAIDLSTALEARGYVVNGKQTMLHETSFALTDYLTIGGVLAITLGSLLI
ncbi:hypothetical protein KSX_11010 [Ktedonospora formicarum]|uniref:Energy-coupling factor transporter transmembrane protein EcfT n=1 Tax=Ktedonospora formicarum TaxID=2778364 RepID=A0A8J3HXU2_9CHLR|nr:hypothetical protein KSX_11010 [Ktedonospora formicarum]